MRHLRTGALWLALSAVPSIANADTLVEQFVSSCIATLPNFDAFDATLESTGFEETKNAHQWIRSSDSAVIQVQEGTEKTGCMVGLIGDHVQQFSTAIQAALANDKLGHYEAKSYEGRTLYLLQTERGLTLIEVIPPFGAATYLVAYVQKE